MANVDFSKLAQPFKDINWKYAIKGIIYAVLLTIGTLVGALMRNSNVNGYTILTVVAILNTTAVLLVFFALKKDFQLLVPKQKSKKKQDQEDKYVTEADRK